jgi:hypothetical protein
VSDPRPPDEVQGYYAQGGECGRLDEAYFPLERERTQELVRRVEREPALLGASPHLLAVGRR